MRVKNRSTDEFMILVLSGATALSILPFVIVRVLQQQWVMVALDTFAASAMIATFAYVLTTGRTEIARWLIAGACVVVMVITVYIRGVENILWTYPAVTALFFLLRPVVAFLVSAFLLLIISSLVWQQINTIMTFQFLISSTSTMLFCFAFSYRTYQQQRELTRQATMDGLTGVGNRRALEEKLLDAIEIMKRYPDQTDTILLIDLDKFKDINDRYGHGAGDTVLIRFTEVIGKRLRVTDKIYRYGGEEFVIIATSTNLEEGSALAESLRAEIENTLLLEGSPLTISIGIAEYIGGETRYEWLQRADAALYRAKQTGRNICCTG